ncbi:putative inactive G-type lectin S-receptor-like serine/threonine-protein kinase SRK [Miscanthus floridulus]|uniref:putative inactive G-type lectin S-receptor-like serine/threonine-protein kinase SRK n=1 Tax=Miscanthus floridulus TaxID=154761 RepID=UPI00345959C0
MRWLAVLYRCTLRRLRAYYATAINNLLEGAAVISSLREPTAGANCAFVIAFALSSPLASDELSRLAGRMHAASPYGEKKGVLYLPFCCGRGRCPWSSEGGERRGRRAPWRLRRWGPVSPEAGTGSSVEAHQRRISRGRPWHRWWPRWRVPSSASSLAGRGPRGASASRAAAREHGDGRGGVVVAAGDVVVAAWWRGFFYIFFENFFVECRFSTRQSSLPSARQKTLGKDSFAESLFAECRLPRVTLDKAFTEYFLGFAVCPEHTAKLLITVVLLFLLFSLFLLALTAPAASAASDILGKGRNITDDGDSLVSAGGSFTLGFFSPGVPSKRYLGIWFSVSEDAVCWVANRDRPLADTSGALVITDAGSLLLLDGSDQVVWSSNTTSAAAGPASAQLLESGNLVVLSDPSSSAVVLWQSFDHPSNTLLPGMNIGKNLWTGAEWRLTSWRSASDPSSGRYWYTTDTRGVPENVLRDGDVERYRTGPWNGLWFSGIPEMATYSDMFAYELTVSPGEVTYGYVARAGAPLSRLLLTDDGVVQRLVWDAATRAWKNFYQGPRDVCDAFGRCGAFGVCDAAAASTSFCGCARGFSPASPAGWRMRDCSGGCRRNAVLDCAAAGNGTTAAATADGFLRVRGVKLPDAHNVSVDVNVSTLEECGARCMANCSCVAYAPMDIRGGGAAGSGCIMWTDGLVDLRLVDGGQDLYLRSARSELGEVKPPHRSSPTARVVGASVSSFVMVLLIIFVVLLMIRRHLTSRISGHARRWNEGCRKEVNVIVHSSLTYDQCETAFMREVELMSKLRHGNLIQLLAYCKDGNERLLVYEYMQNKSLSFYIFGNDPKLRASLNWERRLEIIRGVAKGVAYLHGE